MSLEAEKLEVQCGSSTCEGSTKSRISQAETQNEHQDPVPFAPTQVTSMLARRSTFSSAISTQMNRGFSCGRRARRPRASKHSAVVRQQDEGAPVERDAKSIECDSKSILKLILSGDLCLGLRSPEGLKTMKMPRFDDLRAYLPADLKATKLWEDEAARLVKAVKSPNEALAFSSKDLFHGANEKGYQCLAKMVETILSALSLCLLDNECIYVESCKPLANRDRLEKLIQQAQVSQTNSEREECRDGEGGDQVGKKEVTLDTIFTLIDYISAVLAKLFSQMAAGKHWCDNVLAVLTQRVTKLKVLLLDMHANTLISCQAGEAALDRTDISSRLSNGILEEEECEEVLRIIDSQSKQGLTTTATAEVARYCVNQNRFRSGIDTTIRYLLLSLRFQNQSGLSSTSFEVCGMVYATGFEDFKALLFQDLDLEYSASSDQDILNTAYSAFKILNQTVEKVNKGTSGKPNERLQTTIEWRYREAGTNLPSTNAGEAPYDLSLCPPQKAVMESMDDIITVMIPLILTSPIASANLTQYRNAIALACGSGDVVQPFKEREYCAFFRMFTNRFEDDTKAWDVMRLSKAVEEGKFSRVCLISGEDSSRIRTKEAKKMADRARKMDSWVMDESGITVNCHFQVCYIVFVAFLIAAGGLCFIAAGEHITGVDPSNLSTYLWIVAGFYLLVYKSRFVETWPWSDFLHFRVRCRSVSELHAISDIPEQFIMAKLLHDERGGSQLKTRGPYNKVFLQRDSSNGFSIDRPLQMRTMLLSGLIMLKVVTPRGHALVCLDARRGTERQVVEHQGNQTQEHLVCTDINRLQDQHGRKNRQDGIRLQLAMSKNLKWKRVQGVYKDMQAVYV